MIPKKLQIKNFLSYGPETQTIDFVPYNLICLSGKNGHGKSAMLDAITWSLWGHARKTTGTSKADEGLVHLGQKHMLVIFDFEINHISYRVRREFVKTGSNPFSALDFGIVKDDETFTTLTDKTIKATQDKLEKTIGISYESFINSAFLRQGQANEFSKKSPKERKDILGTILQLERFEDLKKVALEKSKTLQQQLLTHQSIYNRIQTEIQELQTLLADKQSNEEQIKHLDYEQQLLEKILLQDSIKKEELAQQYKQYELLQIQRSQLQKQITQLEEQSATLQTTYEKIAAEQKNNNNIQDIEKQHQQLRTLVSQHQEKLNKRLELKDEYLSLQEKKQALEKQIDQQKSEISQQYQITLKVIEEKIINQESLLAQQEKNVIKLMQELDLLSNTLQEYQQKIDEKTVLIASQQAQEKQLELYKNEFQTLQTKSQLINQQISDISKKHTLSFDNNNPSCPLCEQNLSTSRKKFLEQKFENNHQTAQQELSQIQLDISKLHAVITDQQAIFEHNKKEHDEHTKLVLHVDSLKEQYKKVELLLQSEHKEIALSTQKYNDLQKHLADHHQNYQKSESQAHDTSTQTAYETFIKKIDVLKQTAQSLKYDKLEHQKDYQALQSIEAQLNQYQNLQKEIAQQEQRLKQINDLHQQTHAIALQIKDIDTGLDVFKNLPDQITAHTKEYDEHTQQAKFLNDQKSILLNKKIIFDLQDKKVHSLQNERVTIDKEIQALGLEIHDFTEIVKALGKDGLQALLIEQALPEIEQEANILLAQLTDNQTQIFIESLRDLKKGGSKETLDIKISDSIGLRPYEMFSGGEAFRIDFALRIAISKLLARRAGTALQTLIIDEGFGSQDDDGLQLIMDSILKIQDNFAKVIIVSHLPSMKEQFPVQFMVQKKPFGSTVTVIQQG